MRSLLIAILAWLTRPGPTGVYRGTPTEHLRPALRIYPRVEEKSRR